jgi:signal transduction histidine kinase
MSTPTAPPARPDAALTEPAGARRRHRPRLLRGTGVLREAGVYLAVLGLGALVDVVTLQWWPAAAVVLLGGIALALRRRWPLLAAAVPVVILTWANGAGLPLLVLCYGAGYRVSRRAHLSAWLAGYVAVAVATIVASWRLGAHALWAVVIAQVAFLVLLVVLPGLIGQYRAQRHALVAAWRDRAERAERERVIIAEQARLRERTRIAQDMHDALGHQLALISLQAASLEVDGTLGAAQRETTRLLGATARAAMDELRVVVGALHPADETAPELPLRGIDELVERARGAGLQVNVAHEGQEQPLSIITAHALYRVLQESLTNAHKHAPGSPVTVTLRYEPGTLVAEVRNPRLPARAASARGGAGGQGIIGLRERVRVIGGLLRAGPDGADYRVVAILPYQAKATEPDQVPVATAVPAPAGLRAPADPEAAATVAGVPPPRGRPRALWVGVACILLLFAGSVLLSTRTNSMYLSRAVYDSVQVGQPERAVTRRLPHQLLPGPQDPGCKEFWVLPSDAGPDRGRNTGYRLCFGGGVLISKDELRS